jgi:hypothetical protein
LKHHFEELKRAGQASQTPSQFWFHDSETGDEGFFGMSPLTELQGLLTETVAGDDRKIALARSWYVRGLRHVPTATDRDRDAGERSVSEMLSALDDWRQQPTGDLPLLTFAEGLAERVLPDAERQQVKGLTARRARERGLDDADIETARARLREEFEKVPDALQVFLVPERTNLSAEDPQMTFEVSLHVWLGTSDIEGGCAPYGHRKGQNLSQAKEYINSRLVTDLADSPPAFIEFFLPYSLVCCEVDQWPYKADDAMPFAPLLGTEFPVVIRSYDRMLKPALRESSKKRWPFDPLGAAPAGVCWLEHLQQTPEQLYKALRAGDRAPCLVLGVPAGPEVNEVWRASVWAGVSIGVWLRSGARSPADARVPLCGLLTGQPIGDCPISLPLEALRDLPRRVYEARQQNPNLCLTLCWDDPYRLPPVGWQVPPGTDQTG